MRGRCFIGEQFCANEAQHGTLEKINKQEHWTIAKVLTGPDTTRAASIHDQ